MNFEYAHMIAFLPPMTPDQQVDDFLGNDMQLENAAAAALSLLPIDDQRSSSDSKGEHLRYRSHSYSGYHPPLPLHRSSSSVEESSSSYSSSYHPYQRDPNQIIGRWSEEEHELFLKGLQKFGRCWKDISELIPTRTVVQVRTHAQKYFQKVDKLRRGEYIRKEPPAAAKPSRRRSNSLRKEESTHKGFKLTTREPLMRHSSVVLPQLPPHYLTSAVAPDIEQLLADEDDDGLDEHWIPPRFQLH